MHGYQDLAGDDMPAPQLDGDTSRGALCERGIGEDAGRYRATV
ncbi:hypothetical protein [Luteimonas sp. S4-F44]|nr:hypothetical protein [Luteimonas sp. S4-F44]